MSKTSTITPSFQWKTNTSSVCLFEKQNLTAVPVNFDTYLYLTPKHLSTQTLQDVFYFFLFRINEPAAAAVFQCVASHDHIWSSPARAPFGGIQCDPKCTTNELIFLLHCIEQFALSNGAVKIILKTEPSCYNLHASKLLSNCFQMRRFWEREKYINHSIPITTRLYTDFIHNSEIRRLKKCRSANFVSALEENLDVDIIYRFLESCRFERGYSISLTMAQLAEIFTKFPKEVYVFTVKHLTEIVALSVVIRVNKSIIYNFLSTSLSNYSQYSPAVMLTEAIYIFCQKEKISLLDLGISLDHHGNEKAELMRFKENIGGIKSHKIIYEKVFQ